MGFSFKWIFGQKKRYNNYNEKYLIIRECLWCKKLSLANYSLGKLNFLKLKIVEKVSSFIMVNWNF